MDKKTWVAVGLLIVVVVFSLELIRSGPSPDDTQESVRDLFIGSAGSGDLQTVQELLKDGGVDVNVHGSFGGPTALIVAARLGHVEIVKTLLAHGAEVNAEDDYGQTALYFAKKNSRARIVEILEAAGGTSPPLDPLDSGAPLSDV